MRNVHLLFLFAVLHSSISLFAQGSANTNLNVVLGPIQSIKVNPAQNNVTVSLSTSSEYMNGKASEQQDHIEVMSNPQYQVTVSAATHLVGETSSIDISTISVTPSFGSLGGNPGGIVLTPQALSLNSNTLVQSSHGDTQRTFNMKYQVSGGEAYVNKPAGTYTTTITYTILVP